ncbi:MAG: hypothetical protein COX19_09780 [Desulfobacterales bacterium CG23_combo_of_CG06-09_8_20_14_all_51_8]|nr:MAG: hypothetical protein COX19_09780 [Desulfobacterales bacterium CG23_combo_of_CG06-09_8_20_14_all_51_8]
MPVDLSKEFRLAIAKAGGQKSVALKIGISEPELSRKLNGERGWKIHELQRLFEIAELYLSNGSKDVGDFHLIREMSRKLSEMMGQLEEVETQIARKESEK